MTRSFILKNGVIVNEGLSFKGGIFVKDGVISDIYDYSLPYDLARQSAAAGNCTEYDLEGRCVLPGVIDSHVHFREPGATEKGCISSESTAAVAGGVTSYLDMPNNNPPAVSAAALAAKAAIASRESRANYGFYLGATESNFDEISAAAGSGACGVKVFLGTSTGSLLVSEDSALRRIFDRSPLLIAAHCEDNSVIARNLETYKTRYGNDIPMSAHPLIRSRQACLASVRRAVGLALETGARLHILHISTAEEVDYLAGVMHSTDRITAETCVLYLWFDDTDYDCYGSQIKCNPAIKGVRDRAALTDAVRAGVIKCISTDHAPHLLSDKSGGYLQAASGIPLVQYSLLMMLEKVREGVFDLPAVVDRMCHAPARLFGIDKRGFIRKGFYADLTVCDLESPSDNPPLSRCGWSPLTKFSSSILYTFVNGNPVYSRGRIADDAPCGMPLFFIGRN